jgi:L-arabinose isomerase
MAAQPSRPRVGLLALTLEFYEKQGWNLRVDREEWVRREVLPALEPLADVAFAQAVFRREDVDAVVAGFEAQGVDALLVMLLSYSPSQIALPALTRTRLPIVVWNTQELFAVDETYDGPKLAANHGVHGTQDLCNVLLRSGVAFHYVTSHLDDEAAVEPLADFFAAAAAVARLRRARLGLLGYPFPGMGDFALDTTHMAATLGCQWTALTVSDYIARSADASADEAMALAAEYRRLYDVAHDVGDADLEATARAELALRGMVAEHRLDALTYQFLAFGDDDRTPTLPFVAASRLMAEGIGFGGEGDLIAAAGTALLNWLQPPASFAEIFTIDFAGNSVLMSHMGEANVAMARSDRAVPLVARPTPIVPTRERQLALAASFEPGPATLCALTLGPGGRWRLVTSAMTIADFGPLPDLAVPHFKLEPAGDVRDFLTAYATAGGPHHSAVCFGDARPRLGLAARLLDADYCEV